MNVTIKLIGSLTFALLLLILGFWAFVLEGYVEDAGTDALRTWPIGAALYVIAGTVVLMTVRRMRPDYPGTKLAVVGLIVALAELLLALIGLDAGGNSFEF